MCVFSIFLYLLVGSFSFTHYVLPLWKLPHFIDGTIVVWDRRTVEFGRHLWKSSSTSSVSSFKAQQICTKNTETGLQRNYNFSTCPTFPIFPCCNMRNNLLVFLFIPFVTSVVSKQTPFLFIFSFMLFSHPSVLPFRQYFKVILVFYQQWLGKSWVILFRMAHWKAPVKSKASPPFVNIK